MAATLTQSVAITCAQIATIPTNSASEASVAISSTMARPMLLTPQCPKIQRVRVLECAFSRPTLGKALVSLVAPIMERFNCTPNTRFIVNVFQLLRSPTAEPILRGGPVELCTDVRRMLASVYARTRFKFPRSMVVAKRPWRLRIPARCTTSLIYPSQLVSLSMCMSDG